MNEYAGPTQLQESDLPEARFDLGQAKHECLDQVVIADIPGGEEKESGRRAAEDRTVDKVPVLRDDDATFRIGNLADLDVRRTIALRKIECVKDVVPQFAQPSGESRGKLRVQQEPHAAFGSICLTRLSRAA